MSMIENNEDLNTYTFVPFNESDPPMQSVAQVAFDKLSQFKVVTIIYYNDKGSPCRQHFTKSKKTFYNKRTNTFALKSLVDDSIHTISTYNIAGVEYPSTPEQEEEFIMQAEASKTAYVELSSTCSSDYDLAGCFFDSKLQGQDCSKLKTMVLLEVPNITEFNTPSLETLDKSKDKITNLIKNRVVIEKQNIEKEFTSLSSAEVSEDTNVELSSILEFLTQIETETIKKVNTAMSIEEIIEAWPPVLGSLLE